MYTTLTGGDYASHGRFRFWGCMEDVVNSTKTILKLSSFRGGGRRPGAEQASSRQTGDTSYFFEVLLYDLVVVVVGKTGHRESVWGQRRTLYLG
jgi:hypothetical protein